MDAGPERYELSRQRRGRSPRCPACIAARAEWRYRFLQVLAGPIDFAQIQSAHSDRQVTAQDRPRSQRPVPGTMVLTSSVCANFAIVSGMAGPTFDQKGNAPFTDDQVPVQAARASGTKTTVSAGVCRDRSGELHHPAAQIQLQVLIEDKSGRRSRTSPNTLVVVPRSQYELLPLAQNLACSRRSSAGLRSASPEGSVVPNVWSPW